MNKQEIKYTASNDDFEIKGQIWKPDREENIKAVVQIAHGMCEHINRYDEFAAFLAERNYIVCANDHAGHGGSYNGIYGYMGEQDGFKHMVEDMHTLYSFLSMEYQNIPYILMGHSMGSFLARYYCEKYGEQLNGIIYSGTGEGPSALNIAILLVRLLIKLKGAKTEAVLLDKIMAYSNKKRFEPIRTKFDWLSRDKAKVDEFIQDQACGFVFTYQGYLDLFVLYKLISRKGWYEAVPKELPTYFFSGTDDPIGSYGKGVERVHQKLVATGSKNISMKLYEGGRHEMLNETNRVEVFEDVYQWIEKTAARC